MVFVEPVHSFGEVAGYPGTLNINLPDVDIFKPQTKNKSGRDGSAITVDIRICFILDIFKSKRPKFYGLRALLSIGMFGVDRMRWNLVNILGKKDHEIFIHQNSIVVGFSDIVFVDVVRFFRIIYINFYYVAYDISYIN